MSPVYLYAVIGAIPAARLGDGLAGEPVRALDCDDVVMAVGTVAEAPDVSPETLRAHDAVIRRLGHAVDAVLPARFGAIAPDEAILCERLRRSSAGLREALARVRGREQMILRLYAVGVPTGERDAAPESTGAPDAGPEATGAGTRYLRDRARSRQAAAEVRELEALRPVLDPLVSAERIERHDTPPLLASVYHLVARGTAGEYERAVEEAARRLHGVRVTISGPWAPYAFAPASWDE